MILFDCLNSENRLDYYAYQQPGFFPNSQQSKYGTMKSKRLSKIKEFVTKIILSLVGYRSGITQSSFLPSNDENELTGDQFRNQEVFSDLAPVKHYQVKFIRPCYSIVIFHHTLLNF